MIVTQMIGKLGSQGDFKPFNGIKYQKPQLSVENIKIENIIKVGTSPESMGSMFFLIRQAIGPKAIVVQLSKVEFCFDRVIHYKVTGLVTFDLLTS